MDKISVGDRVLLNNQFDLWHPTKKFPVVGSEYECIGTIARIEKMHGVATVQWDNGEVLVNIDKQYLGRAKEENIESIW